MFVKLILCLCSLLNAFIFSNEDDGNSSSQKPSSSSISEQTLIQLVQNFKEISEIKRRLTDLQSQNVANTLKFEQALSKLAENLKETNNRLKILESQNVPINLQLTHFTDQYTDRPNFLARQNDLNLPKNCKDEKNGNYNVSSTYLIKPQFASNSVRVLCDLEKKNGGWTYILKRFDGTQSFDLEWEDYKKGFRSVYGEFWLGLDNIHYLTGYTTNELLVELVDWNITKVYAQYLSFGVGNEDEGYKLKVLEGYSGTAGDSLRYHVNMKFSTKDKDQDLRKVNCASLYGGGWWFKSCMNCYLTGLYFKTLFTDTRGNGIHWHHFRGLQYSLKEVRMMVRPREQA